MEPFSLAVPKELAPLGARPALHRVIDEAAAAGLDRIAVISAPGKDLLERYVEAVQAKGDWVGVEFSWLLQEEPLGLGDAISLAREFSSGESFALLLPDNLPLADEYRLDDLLTAHERHDRHVVGVLRLDHSWSGLYGNCGRIDSREIEPDVVVVEGIADKRPGKLQISAGEEVLRTCGRYVCQTDIFERIEALRPTSVGELDEVPAYQQLASEGKLIGRIIPPPLFDVGHARGLLAASAWLASPESSAGRLVPAGERG